MAVPTVEAVYTSHSNDGGNAGKAVTTDTTPSTGDYLLYCMCVNANGDTLTAPGGWTEATVSDNSIASTGGQIRAWYLKDPADSTTYTWTVSSSTRRTCIALLIRGADGTTFIDVKESAQSAPGTNHTPPALTTTVADTLVVDFAGLRQFSPDTANWTVPASGLTWTERADLQGSDGNNNVRLAAGTASKTSAGAIGTAVWTNTDANEDSIIIRIAIKPAASSDTNAPAENAAATGTANDATVSASVSAEATAATGTANDATVSTSVSAEATSATGAANDATVSAMVNAEATAATGAALDATPYVYAYAQCAEATGTALDASLSLQIAAEVAAATGSALDAAAGLSVLAEAATASGTGTGYDATTSIEVAAGVASATGAALDPSIGGASVPIGGYPIVTTSRGALIDTQTGNRTITTHTRGAAP